MARTHHCTQHPDRAVLAWCDQCGRPSCSDCTLELFDQYLCPVCKTRAVSEVSRGAVQQDALRAVVIASVGVLAFGLILGPYAIVRARMAARSLERTPWLRGWWHVRATYFIGALALIQGLIGLAARFIAQNPAGV